MSAQSSRNSDGDEDLLLLLVVECLADWNDDGHINASDFSAYLNDYNRVLSSLQPTFNNPDLAAPIGVLNMADVLAYINLYAAACP